MSDFLGVLTPHHWSLITVLAATVAAHLFFGILLRRLGKVAATTSNVWDDAFYESARRPLPAFIWLTGIFTALYLHYASIGSQLPELVTQARNISLTICTAWFLFGLIRHVAELTVGKRTANSLEVDLTTIDGISKVSRIAVVVLAGLAIIQSLGFNISGVLAFGGISGIAIGFAAKDLLANFLGGLMLHIDRPFKLGESIRSPDKSIEGQVEYIGWRQTALRAVNKDVIYVPNSLFNSIVLVNLSRRSHRRIEETIGLRYEDLRRIPVICSDTRTMLLDRSDVDTSKDVIVSFSRYGESSLDLYILAFTHSTGLADFNATLQSVLLAIADIVSHHGADYAFPTRTLLMANAAPDTKATTPDK
ncbi:MAG: mechanosensitive ion channel family protein [Gallionella sp.]